MSEDKRVFKTRRTIERTFLNLLQSYPFDKITVQMITEEALVNKGTFYRHYDDKYDLAHKVAENTLERLAEHVAENNALIADRSHSSEAVRAILETFNDVLPDLVVLNSLDLPGVNIRKSMAEVIYQGLHQLVMEGRELESLETEAWVIAQLVLVYPEYSRDMEKPLDLFGYILSIHEASELFLPLISDADKNEVHRAYYDATCILPSARPSWLGGSSNTSL
ncbi:MAG: TetR/AcrR family transcriptional regulator [Atopobiaceae bacterium]